MAVLAQRRMATKFPVSSNNTEPGFGLQNNAPEKILLVLTDGELAWDALTNDFDGRRTTAFPQLGRKIVAEEPLWVDLRDASSAEKLDTANPDFKGAVARLSSALRLHGGCTHICRQSGTAGQYLR
jgi:hypothetical protein